MDLSMSIAALSMGMHAAQFSTDMNIAMMKKTMEVQEMALNELLSMMPSIDPSLGGAIDVYA